MIAFLRRVFPPLLMSKFISIGTLSAVWGMIVLYGTVEIVGLHYAIGGVISWLVASIIAYIGNSWWTFALWPNMAGLMRFISSRLGTTVIGYLLYLALTEWGIWYLLSSPLSTAIVTLANYLTSRYWVWKD